MARCLNWCRAIWYMCEGVLKTVTEKLAEPNGQSLAPSPLYPASASGGRSTHTCATAPDPSRAFSAPLQKPATLSSELTPEGIRETRESAAVSTDTAPVISHVAAGENRRAVYQAPNIVYMQTGSMVLELRLPQAAQSGLCIG